MKQLTFETEKSIHCWYRFGYHQLCSRLRGYGIERSKVQLFRVEQWVDFFDARKRANCCPHSTIKRPKQSARGLSVATVELNQTKRKGSEKATIAVVGSLARDRGLQLPGRQISSARVGCVTMEWIVALSILPWQSDDDVEKLSPVEASSRYLAHIRECWDRQHREHPLAEQDVVLTLPASFDQVARQLTIEAAAQAGLPRVLLIEEPQAAFLRMAEFASR